MNLGLAGKSALVTGSTSGIGEAIARQLAAEGVRVLIHGRRKAQAHRVVQAIRAAGGDADQCIADLATDQGAADLVRATRSRFRGVDILVNNAGSYDFETTWSSLTVAAWLDRYNVNVGSAVRVTSLLLADLKARGWGRVVNISSSDARNPSSTLPEYAASKAALANLTITLAHDCLGTGVTANCITPGFVLTPPVLGYLRQVAQERGWPERDDRAIAGRSLHELFGSPRGGWGQAEDVAFVAAMICSTRADWLTGSDVRVDGGGA